MPSEGGKGSGGSGSSKSELPAAAQKESESSPPSSGSTPTLSFPDPPSDSWTRSSEAGISRNVGRPSTNPPPSSWTLSRSGALSSSSSASSLQYTGSFGVGTRPAGTTHNQYPGGTGASTPYPSSTTTSLYVQSRHPSINTGLAKLKTPATSTVDLTKIGSEKDKKGDGKNDSK